MDNILRVAKKEFSSFFATPAAWLFLGAFLLVSFFTFFWGETFFARNIADLKPLFKWMPILLLFLVSTLTMRSWSEERRSGTLESLLTSPIHPGQLILGKFLGSLSLVILALFLTFSLPITVSILGPLDWGPVFGGYLASVFVGAAYVAIGLYMSSNTDNPIVALILSVLVMGGFYFIGSPMITSFFGSQSSAILQSLGTGSRFESITRGVLDIRDLYYYLSIVGVFLALNFLSLESLRWSKNPSKPNHRRWKLLTGLIIANFFFANLWLAKVDALRIDLSQGHIYSLSHTTKEYVSQLQEPLLIRGYFSSKSHPLLEPLVPQIKDLLKEYQVIGKDKVRVEFIDPHSDESLEQEAAEKYGIRPMPFRVADRYQSGVVNSYFNILVSYGDQYEVLSYDNLIEVKTNSGQPEVLLNNPEYALTRAIRKVGDAYQSGGDVFANLDTDIAFLGYLSPNNKLPKELADFADLLRSAMKEIEQNAGGKLDARFLDPDEGNGEVATKIENDYGFSPQVASLIDPQPFWFYLILKKGDEVIQIPIPEKMDKASIKKSIESAAKRMAPGFMKTVAFVLPPTPPQDPRMMQMGLPPKRGKSYRIVRQLLSENFRVKEANLKDGTVPSDVDFLVVLGPENFSEKQLFAMDQFLMRGGSVFIASSPNDVDLSRGQLNSKSVSSGLSDWLNFQGLELKDAMVLDPKNASLPVPVERNLGGVRIQEIKMMPYPHFPDLRKAEINQDLPITSGLGQMTLTWVSPILVDKEKSGQRQIDELFRSSDKSWVSPQANIIPDYQTYPDNGFSPADKTQSYVLGLSEKGKFDSYFKDKENPLLKEEAKGDEKSEQKPTKEEKKIRGIIKKSADSARIILVSSNSFASDTTLSLLSQGQGSPYAQQGEFMQNAIDWSLDDPGLLSIRSRAQLARTLEPIKTEEKAFWEYLNYGVALIGLLCIAILARLRKSKKLNYYNSILEEV